MYIVVLLLKSIDEAEQVFLKAAKLGENPSCESREPDLPVGLKVKSRTIPLFSHSSSSKEPRCHMLCKCFFASK